MPADNRFGSKPSKLTDPNAAVGARFDAGPYIGIIKNNVDPTRSGRLQVFIPDLGGQEDNPLHWRTVRYASPFFGTTTYPAGKQPQDNDWTKVSHTYGMWFTPPDIDNQVLITFVLGNPSRGFWFACINSTVSHNMMPGIAGSTSIDRTNLSPDLAEVLTGDQYPTVEFNETNNTLWNNRADFPSTPKPIHEEQVRVLLEQGLEDDMARGVISSSSQRESPSAVFGISTPGRDSGDSADLDPTTKSPHYRLGGHQFIMDDGDATGVDQMIRLRTAGGHQLMLNDSEEVMYFGNCNGSVWMEFTSAGEFHVYTNAQFNLRAGKEVNIHSDTDINMYAGNDINMYAVNNIRTTSANVEVTATTELRSYAGLVEVNSGSAINMQATTQGTWKTGSDLILSSGATGSWTTASNFTLVVGADGILGTTGKLDIVAGAAGTLSTKSTLDILAGSKGTYSSSSEIDISAGTVSICNGVLEAAGGQALVAAPAAPAAIPAPEVILPAPIETQDFTDSVKTGLKWQATGTVASSVTTLPTHEPWLEGHNTVNNQIITPVAPTLSVDPIATKPGPASAIGAGVVNPAATNAILIQPSSGLTVSTLSVTQTDALKAQIGNATGGNYAAIDSAGALGKYKADAFTLYTQGFVVQGTTNTTLNNPSNWTGKNGITSLPAFLASTSAQEATMNTKLGTLATGLTTSGLTNNSTSPEVAGGLLSVANGIGVPATEQWVANGSTVGTQLYNQGRYAVNVLANGAIPKIPTATVSQATSVVNGIIKPT